MKRVGQQAALVGCTAIILLVGLVILCNTLFKSRPNTLDIKGQKIRQKVMEIQNQIQNIDERPTFLNVNGPEVQISATGTSNNIINYFEIFTPTVDTMTNQDQSTEALRVGQERAFNHAQHRNNVSAFHRKILLDKRITNNRLQREAKESDLRLEKKLAEMKLSSARDELKYDKLKKQAYKKQLSTLKIEPIVVPDNTVQ